ncbi:hypothetical protein ACFY1L_12675 [Streptomyces sp. NPDC001663]
MADIAAAATLLLALSAFLADRQRGIWIIDAVPANNLVAQEPSEQPQNAH